MSEIHPRLEAYELLRWFCFKISEGRIEPREDGGVHYILLMHPIVENEFVLVHYEPSRHRVYVREFPEGAIMDVLEDLPLIHSFNSFIIEPQEVDFGLFPFVVDLHEEEVTYHYSVKGGGMTSIKIPMAQYKRFKAFFDELNPIPWAEREDPNHTLDKPVIPDERR